MDWELASSVLPKMVVKMLKYFRVNYFDMKKWNKDYEPCISSFFLFGAGGSYDFDDENYGVIYVHNGTLARVDETPMSGHSKRYARAYNKKYYPNLQLPRVEPIIPDLNLKQDFINEHYADEYAGFKGLKEKYTVPAYLARLESDLTSYEEKTGNTVENKAMTSKMLLYIIGYFLKYSWSFIKKDDDDDDDEKDPKHMPWSMPLIEHIEQLLKAKYGIKYDDLFSKFKEQNPPVVKTSDVFKNDNTFCSEYTILDIINGHPDQGVGKTMTCGVSRKLPSLLRLFFEGGYLA